MKQRTILFILMLLPVMASAYDAKIGGIYYNLNRTAKTAEVTHNDSPCYSDDVSIPSEVTYQGVKEEIEIALVTNIFHKCSLPHTPL